MRLGLAALRGSNSRSSAVTSSFARALRLGGLLVSAFRGLCVAIAAIRPPVYLIRHPRRRAAPGGRRFGLTVGAEQAVAGVSVR